MSDTHEFTVDEVPYRATPVDGPDGPGWEVSPVEPDGIDPDVMVLGDLEVAGAEMAAAAKWHRGIVAKHQEVADDLAELGHREPADHGPMKAEHQAMAETYEHQGRVIAAVAGMVPAPA